MAERATRRNGRTGNDGDELLEVSPVRLYNFGNTCYLNSVLQGLAASRPLRDALAEYPGADKALRRLKDGEVITGSGEKKDADEESTRNNNVPLGTPTTETSPALKLFSENNNPSPESLPL